MKVFLEFMEAHFLAAVGILMICGLILGVIGTYVSLFLMALIHLYSAAVYGVGYG
ncbi:membrane protein [Arthrobacter phage Argan]|nr:membrane protein [Arthrobacter phage Argan]